MEDDPLEDEFPFKDDDNSVATVPILPLLLPQHEPSITNDEHSTSTDNPGSTNNDDSDDDIVIIILNWTLLKFAYKGRAVPPSKI